MPSRSQEVISFTMSRIHNKDTGIEIKLRHKLKELGISYRVCSNKVIGHPDVLLEKCKIAIFADSEFWHGYHFDENEARIHSNRAYWIPKIKRNIERDKEVNKALTKQGYLVLRFWGFEINKDFDNVINKILLAIKERKAIFEQDTHIEEYTTLAYIERGDEYLFLYRNKKKNDPNEGKYIGIGGHIEKGESVVTAFKREIKEETGLDVTSYIYKGKIDFINPSCPHERMYLYKVTGFKGELIDCDEGRLRWVKKDKISELNLWEGDKVFLPLLDEDKPPFRLTLLYSKDKLEGFIGPKYNKEKKKHGR